MSGFKEIVNLTVTVTVLLSMMGKVDMQTFAERRTAIINVVYDGLDRAASLRPVSTVNTTLTVNMDLNIVAIIDFDEQNGFIEISGYLNMEWIANAYQKAADFEDLVFNSVFWKPQVVLVSATKKAEEIGTDESVKVRYNFATKTCSWKPWFVIRSSCSADVKFYPFDKQSCSFKLATSVYDHTELVLTPKNAEVLFDFYEDNAEWEITESSSTALIEDNVSIVEYTIKITRRPVYYVVNLLAPIILLGALNSFVFILPTESGERIGFAMTCFLAYVVFIAMIMEFLPSSVPIAYLTFYTFSMMLFSAGMTLATIITIRIYNKREEDKVPSALSATYNFVTCAWILEVKHGEATWKQIAMTVDVFFFFAFLIGQIFYSIAYLVPLILNA